jgi:iron complex transport system ATP-binding protein
MSLAVRGVAFSYPGFGRPAVEGVDLVLERGRRLAVVGANGAGKSTLLGLLSGRLAPLAGDVSADGRALAGLAPRVRARTVAALPQSERIPFDFSCLEFALFGTAPNLALLAQPGAADAARARRVLEELGVPAIAERSVAAVSGGELQLVRLARCLIQGSPYLILDEPTAMLDPGHARTVEAALRRACRSGRGVVFSTHDLAFAAAVADEVLVLRAGSAIAAGPPESALAVDVLERAFGVPFERREGAYPSRVE